MYPAFFLTLLAALACGLAFAVALGFASAVGILRYDNELTLSAISYELFRALERYPLQAIVLWIFAAQIVNASGLLRGVADFFSSLLGRAPGGLAAAMVLTTLVVGALSGASGMIAASVGATLLPMLHAQRYPTAFGAATQISASQLAMLAPPSITLIIFSATTGVSLNELLVAGIIPAGILALAMLLWACVFSLLAGYGKGTRNEGRRIAHSVLPALFAFLLLAVIWVGFSAGYLSISDAAAMVVVVAIVGGALHGRLGVRTLLTAARKTVIASAALLFLIANASLFYFLLATFGLVHEAQSALLSLFAQPWLFLLAALLLLFVLALVVEGTIIIIVFGPVLAGVASERGIDPVHFGIVFIATLALASTVLPFGRSFRAVRTVSQAPMRELALHLVPPMVLTTACLLTITYMPRLSLVLRDWLFAPSTAF